MHPDNSPHSLSGPRRRGGFTLAELLVVVAIVGVLACLSFVGIRKARQSANRSVSMGNLRACTVAILTYAADHQGGLPNKYEGDSLGRGFISGSLMQPYLPTPVDAGDGSAQTKWAPTWVCPVTRHELLDTGLYRTGDPNLGRFVFYWLLWQRAGKASAGSVASIKTSTPLAAVKLNSVVRPSDALLLANLSGGMRGGYGDGFANLSFVDGSVRRYKDDSYLGGSVQTVTPSVYHEFYAAKAPDGTAGYRGYDW